jgi:hypothetical protein
MYVDDYNLKVQDFTSNSGAVISNDSLTNKFQTEVRWVARECKNILNPWQKWKVVNLNPDTPALRGLGKIHKTGIPIRPVLNFKNAPSYNLAKVLTKVINTHVPLPNVYNVKSSADLIKDIKSIPYCDTLRLASFDINNKYTSIPTDELPSILEKLCPIFSVYHTIKQEIHAVTKLILRQNYYEFQNNTYKQSNGLAMGAPSSSVLSQLFLQHLENTVIYDTLGTENIAGYFRYLDDVLIVYRHDITNIEDVLDKFNRLTSSLTSQWNKNKTVNLTSST